MSLIQVKNATYSSNYGVLFENLSFSINDDDRIGLVGNNGCGKSSLLKCIIGEFELDKGSIEKQRGLQIGYIEQSIPPELEELSLYQALAQAIPEEEREISRYKIDMALDALEVSEEMRQKQIKYLSGGWRRLALIARTNLNDPDVLLLDEPTNHLDVGKILLLEKWLKETVFVPYLVISHDRDFLDNVTNRTLFMRADGVHTFKYSLTRAEELLTEHDTVAARDHREKMKEIDRLQQTAKDFKQKGKAHGSERLSRVAMTLESRIEKLKDDLPNVHREQERKISLGNKEIDYNRPILRIKDLTISIPNGGSKLFEIPELNISKGQRMVVMGLNGSGKSLLVKRLYKTYQEMLSSPSAYDNSHISFNPRVKIGYVDQELSFLPKNEKMSDFIQSRFAMDTTRTIRELVNAGFSVDEQEAKIGTLSYGQKARLMFLVIKNEMPNFYLLDEPSNHLDIDGQRRLEEAILENDNPCVLVSHDRRMINTIGNMFFMIENEKLVHIDSPDVFFKIAREKQEYDIPGAQQNSLKKKLVDNALSKKFEGRE